MIEAGDHEAALRISLAAQNALGLRVRAWVGQTVIPFLANTAAGAESAVFPPVAHLRQSIRARSLLWMIAAGCLGLFLGGRFSRR
jgi:hypothetical protein